MVYVQAGKGKCFESSLSDFVELEVSHFGIGGVFDGGDWLTIDDIVSDLTQEDAVGADILFGTVGGDRFGNEIRGDRAVDENFLWFLFSHDGIKCTDTLHADANANEGLNHGIFKFNAIE